jgi:hypothetical protein
MEAPDSFGNSLLGIVIAVLLIWVFTMGEPDVLDAIRVIVLKLAGME